MQHSWRHEQMIILERFCRNCALEIPPPGRDQRQETGAKASLAGDQNYSFLKTSQHIKKPLCLSALTPGFHLDWNSWNQKSHHSLDMMISSLFLLLWENVFLLLRTSKAVSFSSLLSLLGKYRKQETKHKIIDCKSFSFFFFVLFFFQSAPLLSQLSVCTARGSNGSCLYKTEGAQISRRENWVSLEPQSKANPSMM